MNRQQSRRRFLMSSGAVAISALVPQWGCDSNKVTFREMPTAPPMDMPPDTPMEEMPEARITPNSRFYLQSIKGENYDPGIDAADWSLRDRRTGRQPRSSALAYEAITDMPMVRQTMTMQCIGNWIGGPLVGNAEWGGTPLSNLLGMAGIGDGRHPRRSSTASTGTRPPSPWSARCGRSACSCGR